jgi:hypothetical protein
MSIESIDEEKSGIFDMLLNEGNLNISVEDKSYIFKNIDYSSQVVQDLLDWKRQFTYRQPMMEVENLEPLQSWDKFDILVETLSEVIQDYMERKPGRGDDF